MSRTATTLLAGMSLALLVWGCSGGRAPTAREEMARISRQREWAMVYYQSFQRGQNARYLALSRATLHGAIQQYFDLQVRLGHDYPDFYTVDRQRVQSCRFLHELDREAARLNLPDWDASREGCLK